MTRDFAKPSTTRDLGARSKSAPSGKPPKKQAKQPKKAPEMQSSKSRPLVLFAALTIIAAFIAGLYYLNKVPATEITPTEPASKPANVTQKKTTANTETKERFKFYDLLPKSEVIPPKVDAYKFKEKGKAINFEYVLQTGSFRNHRDAEKQKATIGFQGLKARVEKVVVNENSTWYRVQVGPFSSRSKMNGAMDRLVAIHIQPLVKKNKK